MESNFSILGIGDGANKREIQEAFRRLALLHHSDRGGDAEEFKRIKQAYEDLKLGKKYPDTPREKQTKSRVYTGDDEEETRRRNMIIAGELSREMRLAEEWAGALKRSGATGIRLFGSKSVGEIELERKANGVLFIRGNFMAGKITYDGPISMQGNITSPSFTKENTTLITAAQGDFKFIDPMENKYRIENGSRITAESGNIIVGNVFGRKNQVQDPDGRVGLYVTHEHRTILYAPKGRIVVENAVNTVTLEGDSVMALNLEDDVIVRAREVLIYGSKMTYDVKIHLLEGGTIRFFEKFSVQGLSDDAVIILENGKSVHMHDLKTRKIKDLPDGLVEGNEDHGDATLVGAGFTITYKMIDEFDKKQGRKLLGLSFGR